MLKTFKKDIGAPDNPKKTPKKSSRKRNFKVLLLAVTFLTSMLGSFVWWFWDAPLVSPISSIGNSLKFLQNFNSAEAASDKVVYGFVPYWNIKKAQVHPELTHMSYFSLTIGGDGQLLTTVEGETDQGYHRLQSDEFLDLADKAIQQNTAIEIVLSQFNADDISSFLSSEAAQDNFISSLDNVLLAYPISGINIDIECSGSDCRNQQDNMSKFMEKLNDHLDTKYDKVMLSVDVYASAPKETNIWNLADLEPHVDYFVVMAYDFHRKSSSQAGPVAPLFGGAEYWDSDISSHLQEFLKVIPSKKILLGVPFYGYRWQTVSREPQSHTFPDTGSTASVEDVDSLLLKKEEFAVQEHWNEDALSPYLTYEKDGDMYTIYYENSRSLSYKLDFVNQLDLAGVAIWAVGYEGVSRDLWEVINQKF